MDPAIRSKIWTPLYLANLQYWPTLDLFSISLVIVLVLESGVLGLNHDVSTVSCQLLPRGSILWLASTLTQAVKGLSIHEAV
jgi:hypothetical protein